MPAKYTRELLTEAAARSTTLRQAAEHLGVRPSSGALSHLRRRMADAGVDTGHFLHLQRRRVTLACTPEQLARAAPGARSLRELARTLALPDDGASRAALRRRLSELGIDTGHFSHARVAVPEAALRTAVGESSSVAEVVRRLGLPPNDSSHRKVQRRARELGLDLSHFKRRSRRAFRPVVPKPVAASVLVLRPEGSARTSHRRLRRALAEIGVPYLCAGCGNPGEWLGRPITLQVDHVNGDWLDNRAGNLRYLCPNCHSLTDTWCGRNKGRTAAGEAGGAPPPAG
ncbi:HNH endonuclease [Streptomyces sp. NPDC059506]|uniref:HNH endonuclease signature motif containing protein n=1 Tax=Streptomyces TaxID=1883 RepID=UPI0036B0B93B